MANPQGTLEVVVKPKSNNLVENLILSTFIQIFRIGLPLLVIPLLSRTLSVQNFGLYIYTVSISMWIATLIDYGFGISAARDFPKLPTVNDRKEMIIAIQSAKTLLILAVATIFLLTYTTTTLLTGHEAVLITAFFLSIFTSLQPNYYFQAQERLRYVSIIEIITSILTLALMYSLIKNDEDYIFLPLALLLPRALALAAIRYKVNQEIKIRYNNIFNLYLGIQALRNGKDIFKFQFLVSLYTTFNVVILGFCVSPSEVTPYAVAERLVRAGLSIISQINQVFFWRRSNLHMSKSKAKSDTVAQSFYITGFFGGLGMIFTYFFGEYIGYVLLGQYSKDFAIIIKVMALTIPAIVLSGTLSFQFLLTHNQEKQLNKILFFAAIGNLFLAYFLIQKYNNIGLSYTWLIIEWTIFISLALNVRKQKTTAIR
jgi:PST family polysaccharide transporter